MLPNHLLIYFYFFLKRKSIFNHINKKSLRKLSRGPFKYALSDHKTVSHPIRNTQDSKNQQKTSTTTAKTKKNTKLSAKRNEMDLSKKINKKTRFSSSKPTSSSQKILKLKNSPKKFKTKLKKVGRPPGKNKYEAKRKVVQSKN